MSTHDEIGAITQLPPHLIRIITTCRSKGAIAMIVSNDLSMILRCRFSSVNKEIITFNVLQADTACTELEVQTLCMISFAHAQTPYIFTAPVQRCVWASLPEEGMVPTQIELGWPTNLSPVERRKSFRIPVDAQAGLKVSMKTAQGASFEGVPFNVSMHGIIVAIHSPIPEPLKEGDALEVELHLDKCYVK